jgi:predicted phosphate transport protein (TIGR00153 family)
MRSAARPEHGEVPMLTPFGKTRVLESQVDQFLDLITKATLCMREAIRSYLSGDDEDFQSRLEMVGDYERTADDLRKSTETMLYTYSLIPESRADILGLLENLDNVIDRAKQIVQEFDVQQPDVEVGYLDLYVQVTDKSVKAVEQVVDAVRAFFRNESRLRDCINKVDFYESEADRAGLRLKKQIFQSDMELARKQHLRYFADALESLSDIAEEVSERLAIASIKRSL